MSASSISSSLPSVSISSRPAASSFMAPPNLEASVAAGAAAAARRRVGEALRAVALRLVLRLAAPFRAALFRAVVFRDARERVERFALRAAVDFRPRDALFLRLPLLFFLPRGGILLLRELGSQIRFQKS